MPANDTKMFTPKTNVDPHHDFTIKFNLELDVSTVKKENIYVRYDNSFVDRIRVLLNDDKRSVTVEAPSEGYKLGDTYYLYIEKGVKTVGWCSVGEFCENGSLQLRINKQ